MSLNQEVIRAMTGEREHDERYMKMALEEAEEAGRKGEVPIGAVLVKENRVTARDHNRCIELSNPTGPVRRSWSFKEGKALGNYRLNDTVMYVTVEPCPMCASAMVHGRVSRMVFGTPEPKFGAVESRFRLLEDRSLNHTVEVESRDSGRRVR